MNERMTIIEHFESSVIDQTRDHERKIKQLNLEVQRKMLRNQDKLEKIRSISSNRGSSIDIKEGASGQLPDLETLKSMLVGKGRDNQQSEYSYTPSIVKDKLTQPLSEPPDTAFSPESIRRVHRFVSQSPLL